MQRESILKAAELHFSKGEACLASGDVECARREFDSAIDAFLDQGVDLRADEQLHASWRDMIEKINRHQAAAFNDQKAQAWKTQEFDGRPETLVAEEAEIEYEQRTGPLSPKEFQDRFARLRSQFKEKYSRDIVLTGADHGEHRRLYGKGSAFDVRARDLTREQVTFIISEGNKLGLRIKDFSTWQKVAAHNQRSQELGRPLDTYATGLHLHIDRMMPSGKARMVAKPVAKTERSRKESGGEKSGEKLN